MAGVPSAVVPFGVDQPYHGRRLHQLGVGPAPLPVRQLTADRLGVLIRQLAGTGYQRRAAGVGAIVRAQDGLTRTVDLLDRLSLLA